MKKPKRKYYFEGSIFHFDSLVAENFRAITWAVSEKQALARVAAQYKAKYGYGYDAPIYAEGDICVA